MSASSAPTTISFSSPDAIRFANVCAQCGAVHSNGYALAGKRVHTRVPLCRACDGRKTAEMAFFVIGSLVGAVVFVILVGASLELVLPFPEEHRARAAMGALTAILLLLSGGAALYLSFRRSAALYHRFRSPVFLLSETPGVVFACRNAPFAEATQALTHGIQAGYREPPKAAFVAPHLPGYLGPIAVFFWGVATALVSIVRYNELQTASGRALLRSIELIVYAMGGAVGVSVMYVFVGIFLMTIGALWLRAVRRTRAEILGH